MGFSPWISESNGSHDQAIQVLSDDSAHEVRLRCFLEEVKSSRKKYRGENEGFDLLLSWEDLSIYIYIILYILYSCKMMYTVYIHICMRILLV